MSASVDVALFEASFIVTAVTYVIRFARRHPASRELEDRLMIVGCLHALAFLPALIFIYNQSWMPFTLPLLFDGGTMIMVSTWMHDRRTWPDVKREYRSRS